LNQGHRDFQSLALPTELFGQKREIIHKAKESEFEFISQKRVNATNYPKSVQHLMPPYNQNLQR
jgi:hypothetical protein